MKKLALTTSGFSAKAVVRKILFVLLTFSAVALTGCSASKYSQVVTEPMPAVMEAHVKDASVVFVRDSIMGAAIISAPIACYQEDKNDYRFLGVLNTSETILSTFKPGRYVFVVGGEKQRAVVGELAGGKVYALQVAPSWGMWKARFVFSKLNINNRVIKQFKNYRRVEPNTLGMTRMASMMEKKVNKIKASGAPSKLTLKAEDGLPLTDFKALYYNVN